MDKTQEYIIKQNALTNANVFWQKDDSRTPDKVLQTAQVFADWVMGGSSANTGLPALPKVAEDQKKWLNFNTPEYNSAIDLIKQGYTVKDLRTQHKVSKKVEDELAKL